MYTPESINDIRQRSQEGEVLEFKEARGAFSPSSRSDYCAAIANMGGGKLLLGVANDHRVVGTSVYQGTVNGVSQEVFDAIGITVRVEEVAHPDGRVVIFDIPSRTTGRLVRSNGRYRYPMRRGESLVEMDESEVRYALNEVRPDFSATIQDELSTDDLDPVAVANFRKLRSEKMRNPRVQADPLDRVLSDAGLLMNGRCTFACLVLLGNEESVRRLAPQSEIIYEWRTRAGQTSHNFRKEWTKPYFAIYDEIWQTINARNLRMPFQEGFIQREVDAFDEKSCREAVNNAVAHRDYTITEGSIFIHASPEQFSVTSPGGFLPGITSENIFVKSQWRNRRIADALEHTKLIERSGQGMDDIFEISIRQGKGLPNFIGTDDRTVQINIPAVVEDPAFIQFLEKVANEKQHTFSLDEMMELERVRKNGPIADLRFKTRLLTLGVVEKVGKTRGTKYILSHRYYKFEMKPGEYTRIKGISRKSKKELILEHIRREGTGRAVDFMDAFPDLKRGDIQNLLQELKRDGLLRTEGITRSAVWKLVNKDQK
ncbi:hypothetical protein A3E39_00275 [Candidatus Uhrbacteria bacterium RIFCSPHIGHO2_12_FULL_60_25]|uniref:Schlafen AlbA-2 domain-containing protein n=1 Tax=Candidatus Uhrbacteria bacterium RIFCSPHIGHO2_12_FULL_60_25 TaxID=1802399 RepID=A0A1F7UKN6_9BACT|nr:MAG: hypothetical protein A3D73_00255 [Candidatus Uhrbacteria bacterium RIFCSPHIGHO2_02_FULL_60_44]OGL78850.1 MAG: hypothetical protein A3E39_00275 [Candidatus Uhrbacteria bacterium RIFCSPHIGHO2_12_FULL_60_25]